MKIASWQIAPIHDPEKALTALERAAQRAKARGADLLLTPEMVLGGYNIGAEHCAALAACSDDYIGALSKIAKQQEIALVVGLAVQGPDKPFNAVIALDKNGIEQQRYHKTHLFGDVDRAQFAAGDTLSEVFELNGWSVALAICYDIEFPEVARAATLRGADLILVPTANMIPFDSVPTRLVPTRAEENAVYVAYTNYIGVEGAFTYGGLSCICGPDGNDLARASQDSPEMITAELSHTTLTAHRKLQHHPSDRRPELYHSLLSEGPSDE